VSDKLRAVLVAILSLLVMIPLSGCWDSDSVEQLDYVRALGIDYEEGQYVVYLQLPNLSNVAKKEAPPQEVPNKSWMAEGRGSSINQAVGQILQTSSKKIIWGQTTVLVLGEKMLQRENLYDVFEDLNRFRELRYTMWVYGTKASIPELFEVSPTFYQSRNYTILQNPMDSYKKASSILPIRLHDFMNDYQGKASFAQLPALEVSSEIWKVGEKSFPMQLFDGIFVFHQKNYTNFLPIDKILGLQLLETHTISSSLQILENSQPIATLDIKHPKTFYRYDIKGDEVSFNIEVTLSATLIELHKPMDNKKLEQLAEKQAEELVRTTYVQAVKSQVDIYRIGERIYRKEPGSYNKISNDGKKFFLKPDSLKEVKVHVILDYLGKYKLLN
jgi:Ger(x)C family germination protein